MHACPCIPPPMSERGPIDPDQTADGLPPLDLPTDLARDIPRAPTVPAPVGTVYHPETRRELPCTPLGLAEGIAELAPYPSTLRAIAVEAIGGAGDEPRAYRVVLSDGRSRGTIGVGLRSFAEVSRLLLEPRAPEEVDALETKQAEALARDFYTRFCAINPISSRPWEDLDPDVRADWIRALIQTLDLAGLR